MIRYESRPRSMWDQDSSDYLFAPVRTTGLTVHEPEPRERKIGILDHRGNPIVAVEEPSPIGFGRVP